MSFTERQLRGLHAMGLVAWTSDKDSEVPLVEVDEQSSDKFERAVAQSVGANENKPERPSLTFDELSGSLELTAQWLVHQPLAHMPYRGANVVSIGSERACLLILCLHTESNVQAPLSTEGGQLFDLMMRSIDMRRSELKQCAISTCLCTSLSSKSVPVHLDDVLLPQTRAVLVLDPRPDVFADDDVINKVLLPGSSLPLWRVPHPDILLAMPLLKRSAWESLKGLKRMLTSVMGP